jgi:DNA-binding transcriptional LysR family regulator
VKRTNSSVAPELGVGSLQIDLWLCQLELHKRTGPISRIMSRISWDDLRYVLAVAAEGSLAGAARSLGVSHTTVLRRVNAFEERLGLRLFQRQATGYALTPGGEELVEAARRMEDTAVTLERRLAGQDRRLSGTVRVTTTDTLAHSLLPPVVAAFRARHPHIELELAVSNLFFDLTKLAADIAVRPADKPPEGLTGRRVSTVAFAIFASPQYLASHGDADGLASHDWVAPSDELAGTSVARWMRAAVPQAKIVLRTNSLLVLRHAAAAHLGLAALPCYLGDSCDDLVRVHAPIEAMATALWILTHEDLRRTARVRAFTQFAAAALSRQRALLERAAARRSGPPASPRRD